MVCIQNLSAQVEYVEVQNAAGVRDHVTVQPRGKVTLPDGWRVSQTGVKTPQLLVTGNDAPVSPLNAKE